ncbi:glutathione S-transferase [Polynucleobacter sp. QLW-P1DATA-2]|jgi:glutathione S-transferase|uniref:glutathione S-transferase family protein n=1 Tax=unclassified Polynucleobacter TaxID=2640945 RepID=UPI0008F7FE9A|nr:MULTISPECIES: glutathione S-transferase N-terminal domain-containing protein [unclassified Polynucleobacter]OIM97697.1 glutathione S-transferase [Polynucleobacter sp. MWH-Tro8-2-5-gr]OIN03421.1 glutathione S-transferase [Polynucleobacter sp. QLW-P1DATA-2]
MMRLWGRKSSINVQKVLWCLAELGLKEGVDFERIDAGLQFGVVRSPEFLKLNPNGLVPTLEDGDLILWESNTIMRYLVSQHDQNKRFPSDIASQYGSEKWMDWQVGTMWPVLRPTFIGLTRTPAADRNHVVIQKAYQDTNELFSLLDQTLASQAYCSGNQFHLGDIVLALCVHRWILLNEIFPKETGIRADLKNINRWLKQLKTETHFQEFAEKELNIISK